MLGLGCYEPHAEIIYLGDKPSFSSGHQYSWLEKCKGCGPNGNLTCDTCITITTNKKDYFDKAMTYHECANLDQYISVGFNFGPDCCSDVPIELNEKMPEQSIMLLEKLKLSHPNHTQLVDKKIDELKNVRKTRICTCSTDGCNGFDQNGYSEENSEMTPHTVNSCKTTTTTSIMGAENTNGNGNKSKFHCFHLFVVLSLSFVCK